MRFFLALSACFVLSGVQAGDLIPLSDFTKPTEIKSLTLSPDGKTLALISPDGDYGTVLAFVDTDTMKVTAGFADNGERVPGGLLWASNDRVILNLVKKYGGFAKPALTGELLGVNRDGKRLMHLFGGVGERVLGTRLKTRASEANPNSQAWFVSKRHG